MKKRILAFLLTLLTVLGTFPLALFGVSATESANEGEKLVWDGKYAPLYVQDGLTFFWLGEENKIGTSSPVTGTIENALNADESIHKRTYDRQYGTYYTYDDKEIGASMRKIDKGVVYYHEGKILLTDFVPVRTLSDGTKALADMTLEVSQAYPEYYKTYADQTNGTLNKRLSNGPCIFLGPVTLTYTKNICDTVCVGGTSKGNRYAPITYTDPETKESRIVYIKTNITSGPFSCYEYDAEAGTMAVIEELRNKYSIPANDTKAEEMKAIFSVPYLSKWGVENSFTQLPAFDANGYGPVAGWSKFNDILPYASCFSNFDDYGKPDFMNAPQDTAFTTSIVFDYNYAENDLVTSTYGYTMTLGRDGSILADSAYAGSYDAKNDYTTYAAAKRDDNTNYAFSYGLSIGATYYYSFRIYDKVLSADEQAQNYFVDMAYQLNADLTDYLNYEAETRAFINLCFSGASVSEYTVNDFEAAINAFAEDKQKADEEERLDALYADLYVTDVDGDEVSDLLYRWDAFRLTDESAPVSALQNKAGEGSIAVVGMKAYDRYATFASVPDFTSFLPKDAYGNHADLTFEAVAHQTETKGSGTVALGSMTPYEVKTLSTKDDNKGWIDSTYANKMSPAIVSQTYYFDASGNKVEAAADGGSSVKVNYLKETNVIPSDSSWSGTSWLALPFGEVFTYGAALDYTVNEAGVGSFAFQMLRNGKAVRTSYIAYLRNYSPDAKESATNQRIVPTNRAEAEEMAVQEAYQNMKWTEYTEQLAIGYTGYAYYALRLYNKVLSEAQRNQNHFADLAAYFKIDRELIDLVIRYGQLENVCTALAGVQLKDNNKEAVIKVLKDAYYYTNYLSDYPVLKFEGYQVKNFENKGVRSLYTIDFSKATNATVIEIGAIMAIAANRVTADLTLENANVAGSQMMSEAVWTKDGGFLAGKTFEDENGLHFAYTIVCADNAQALAYGDVELLFRGYVIVEIDGVRYTTYADMTTTAFNDTHKVTLNRAYEKADSAKRVYAQSIQVGATESERRFVWTSERNTEAYVRYALKSAYDADGGFTEANTTVVQGTVTDMYGEATRKSCKVRAEGLELGKEYVYSVGGDYGFEEKVYTFKTQDNLDEHQSFNIISDVHMKHVTGTSASDIQKQIDKFQKALAQMLAYTNDLSFVVSTGDNVSQYAMSLANPYDTYHIIGHNEHEMVFAPELLKTIPFASTMGNHEANVTSAIQPDASVSGYYYDMPNEQGNSGRYEDYSSGNFYFRNGNVLIIGVNVRASAWGNSSNTSGAVAREFVKAACEANTDAKWRILVNHVPAYSYLGNRASGQEMGMMEEIICSICDDYDIDIMFSGHHHAFSRSYPISGHNVLKEEVTTTEPNGDKISKSTDPTGTVYYNVPSAMDHSFTEVEPTYKDYLSAWGLTASAARDVEGFDGISYYSPMYVNCQTNGDTLTVRLILSATNEVLDTYELTKTAE